MNIAFPPSDSPVYAPRSSRERWVEAAIIVAFWSFLALLMASGRIFDPRGGPAEADLVARELGRALTTFYLWALLTPFIFWFVGRFSLERENWQVRAALHLATAFFVAIVVDILTDYLRELLFPGPRRFPMNPLWHIRRLWFINELITYFGVLAAGIARYYFLRYRARQDEAMQLRTQLADARLDALRMQLNPHFLFNTLHAISTLVEDDPRGVRRMIARLSGLLRYTLEETDKQEVPLRQEMAFLRDYLEIQEIRFQGRLDVEESIAEDTQEALLPALILQPLVENAIKHGVSKTEEVGLIRIESVRQGTRLEVTVTDNGPGLATTSGTPVDAGGLGLTNTRERLRALYGDDQALTLKEHTGGGLAATVSVPFRTESELRTRGFEA